MWVPLVSELLAAGFIVTFPLVILYWALNVLRMWWLEYNDPYYIRQRETREQLAASAPRQYRFNKQPLHEEA